MTPTPTANFVLTFTLSSNPSSARAQSYHSQTAARDRNAAIFNRLALGGTGCKNTFGQCTKGQEGRAVPYPRQEDDAYGELSRRCSPIQQLAHAYMNISRPSQKGEGARARGSRAPFPAFAEVTRFQRQAEIWRIARAGTSLRPTGVLKHGELEKVAPERPHIAFHRGFIWIGKESK